MGKSACLVALCFLVARGASCQSGELDLLAKSLGGEKASAGKLRALFIAADAYKRWPPLKDRVRDAKEIRGILASRYYVDEIAELYDGDVTKVGITKALEALAAATKPEDSVLVYYAGRSQAVSGEAGFWIPSDAGADPATRSNWLPIAQVRSCIGAMKARHVALVSDSCFPGELVNAGKEAAPSVDEAYLRTAWSRASRQVLCSGAAETAVAPSEFSEQLKLSLRGDARPFLDASAIYRDLRLGMRRSIPLFGELKDAGHQDGGSLLLFSKSARSELAQAAAGLLPPGSTAELAVTASIEGAEVVVNGVSYGKSPALATELPSGRPLKVTARSGSSYAAAEVTLKPNERRKLGLKLEKMRANMLIASSDKAMTVFVDGEAKGPLGSGAFRELPDGEVNLELKGKGTYYQAAVSLKRDETIGVKAEPWAVGSIAYQAPPDARINFRGPGGCDKTVRGSGRLDNLRVGEYEVATSDLGYGYLEGRVSVEKGRVAAFKLEPAGTVLIRGLPSNVAEAVVDGRSKATYGRESMELGSFVAGKEIVVAFRTAGGGAGDLRLTALPAAGKAVVLDVPSGRLAFDWLPADARVELDGRGIEVQSTQGARVQSGTVLPRAYELSVVLPGIGTYRKRIAVEAGKASVVEDLRAFGIEALRAKRRSRLLLDAGGWASLGVGIAGAAGAGATYYLGGKAMDRYKSSAVTSDIVSARNEATRLGRYFVASAIAGGVGLALAPTLWLAGPPPRKSLDASLRDLEARIASLKK